MKVSDLNRKTPHPTEPTMECQIIRLHRDYGRRKMLFGLCPGCNQPKLHDITAEVMGGRYCQRTCLSCHSTHAYWLHLTTAARQRKPRQPTTGKGKAWFPPRGCSS